LLLKKEFKKGPRERPSLIKNYVFVALLGVLVFFFKFVKKGVCAGALQVINKGEKYDGRLAPR
jgi:hypothetical protein